MPSVAAETDGNKNGEKNRKDEYGAVSKRSTAHALMKVLGVRQRMKKQS